MEKKAYLWPMNLRTTLVLALLCTLQAEAQDSPAERDMLRLGMVDVAQLDTTLHVDLMYARSDNFMGRVL